jgi:transcriptional regulator with XRE-family HTH domain
MSFSLGKRLKATREAMSLTQEQVIEQLEVVCKLVISQQTLSYIENGKRKVEAERELPAFAAIYRKPIDYFYESFELPPASQARTIPGSQSLLPGNFEALTHRDKLELAVDLIHNVLQET